MSLLTPSPPDALAACRRALALLASDQAPAARDLIATAVARWPDDPNVRYVAGNCALTAGDDAEALDHYQRSVARAPDFPAALVNLGFVLRRQDRIAEAREVLRRCVALTPGDPAVWLNLTATYVNEGAAAAGTEVARTALTHCPDSPDLHWNLGLLLLEQGQWRAGWREVFHRFDTAVMQPPDYTVAGWRPPRLRTPADLRSGQTVVCHGEQGLGDEILFAGLLDEFLADVRRQGARLVLDCHPRLRTVFARSFPDARLPEPHPDLRTDTPRVPNAGGAPPASPIDWVVPIGDLAGFYRNSDDDFPARGAMLRVAADRVARLRAALVARAGGRPVVGIAWTGGLPWTHARRREIPLAEWFPVLGLDACFVSLEYRDRSAEIALLQQTQGRVVVSLPEITRHPDYDETFHLVAALDLVITVPTSVLHVAGAVGTPCWVVMDERAAWRECSPDDGIPWYPRTHVRFVRRRDAADWQDVFARVAHAWAVRNAGPAHRPRGTR